LTQRLRLSYVRSVISQDVPYLETLTPGAVASDIFGEASTIETGFSETCGVAIQALSTVVASFIVAFTQSWRLTLATGTSIAALFVFLQLTDQLQSRLGSTFAKISRESAGLVEEALFSIVEVISFGARDKLLKKYDLFLQRRVNAGIRKSPLAGAELGFTYFCLLSAYSLAFWYGIRLVSQGEVANGGKVVMYVTDADAIKYLHFVLTNNSVILSINQATAAILSLLPSWNQISKARIALKRFHIIITRRPAYNPLNTNVLRPDECLGRIEFLRVNFSYPSRPDVQVLTDLDLTIEEGKTTAIIGPSGSGKTSIFSLIERWYSQSSGLIMLDGVSTTNLNMRWMRGQIGLVPQVSLR
jgi:ATP-binding cassette, subfamily B (MDR/TAP), member 1